MIPKLLSYFSPQEGLSTVSMEIPKVWSCCPLGRGGRGNARGAHARRHAGPGLGELLRSEFETLLLPPNSPPAAEVSFAGRRARAVGGARAAGGRAKNLSPGGSAASRRRPAPPTGNLLRVDKILQVKLLEITDTPLPVAVLASSTPPT